MTDVTTGEQIQSLRGHEGLVLQLQFDTSKILSAVGCARARDLGTSGEDVPFEPRKTLRDLQYVDKSSISSRFAHAMQETSIDLDSIRIRREANDPSLFVKKNALGTRIKKAIEDSIDPFGEVAAARQKIIDDENLAREKSEREEALAAAPGGGGAAGGPTRVSAKLMTKAEKQEAANAAFIFDHVILPRFLMEEAYTLAEEGLKKVTWNESLAGRLCDTIEDGPMDFEALELLLAQERMKAARLHAAEVRKNLEKTALADRAKTSGNPFASGFSIASIASATSSNTLKRDVGQEETKKDAGMYSDADSQEDISTVVSSDYDELDADTRLDVDFDDESDREKRPKLQHGATYAHGLV